MFGDFNIIFYMLFIWMLFAFLNILLMSNEHFISDNIYTPNIYDQYNQKISYPFHYIYHNNYMYPYEVLNG